MLLLFLHYKSVISDAVFPESLWKTSLWRNNSFSPEFNIFTH